MTNIHIEIQDKNGNVVYSGPFGDPANCKCPQRRIPLDRDDREEIAMQADLKADKILRVPSWLNEPYSVLNNPAYRHPSHKTTEERGWGGPRARTTADNCTLSGTIEQKQQEMPVTDDLLTRKFCGLPADIRVTRSHQVYTALFSGELYIDFAGKRYNRKIFREGVRAFDIGNYRFIEQNPRTQSKWAHMAREGKRILWIIRISDNKWLGRVVEGVLTVL